MRSITKRLAQYGFTLIELVLVMVIVSAIILMATSYMVQKGENLRVDKTALQMQMILNAAMAYYVANGAWPGASDTTLCTNCIWGPAADPLQPSYLAGFSTNPWGQPYVYRHNTADWEGIPANTFVVTTLIPGSATTGRNLADVIGGKLPVAIVANATGSNWPLIFNGSTDKVVMTYVNIPGQNLNNAASMNFAGLYKHGGCVPVPTCPSTTAGGGVTMTPQVFIVPVSVSGVNDQNSASVYPISSFTAYATASDPLDSNPPLCGTTVTGACSGGGANNQYWRACVEVITERGNVSQTRTDDWGQYVTLGAFTRCAISNEPSGSDFSIYGN